jgi:hypothetical protein
MQLGDRAEFNAKTCDDKEAGRPDVTSDGGTRKKGRVKKGPE